MKPGSIIIDMAVSTGGNVEGSDPDKDVTLENGVTIIGGDRLERFVPKDASDMFSGNMFALFEHFWDTEGKTFVIDKNDDIMGSSLITFNKEVLK